MVQLAEAGRLKAVQIADCFGVNLRDWLTFFRSILQLPGTIANRSTDEIVVELRPPDEPKVRHALALTLAELNALGGRTFGDGQRPTFALKS